ncbi:hypothetical protein NM688_g4538 [Phlebia brevispora]|uniref:Uncharacterized protein n=1 Tax=Phlebia brevispora TaxID=194682 RepID=A0ACC1T2U3_9APHY|nr:hypothetical protein NM688_g4538 [Phlebia brevispora]
MLWALQPRGHTFLLASSDSSNHHFPEQLPTILSESRYSQASRPWDLKLLRVWADHLYSRTEPEAFFLELYFNTHPVAQPHSKEKPRVTNALVPTLLAYAGGRMDFQVNMNPDFPTRLMIVKGAFECVSMAIYGDVVSEMSPPSLTYEPKAIPSYDPIPLSNALDPSNFRDPTRLALQLLDLIPDAPPLPLIICLMFCLKPSNDDWDLPEFPYLHADLDEELPDLERAFTLTSRPAAANTSHASFAHFSEAAARLLGPKDENQAYYVAGILCHAASQNPDMATSILECMDITRVFDSSMLDASTLRELIDAAANPDIAKSLNNDWFMEILGEVERSVAAEKQTRALARDLLSRIEGMSVYEDAISNTQGDFARAAATLKDICGQEQSFGIWLASMVTHQDLVDKLGENPSLSVPLQHAPLLFKSTAIPVSHDEFVAFLRALIGVSCVLAVYAWADSLPESLCRERTLSILRLWHGVDGYREILNHLLLLRQMIFRLECMLDNDVPTRAAIDAENILVNLAKEPKAILQPEFTRCILSMKLPQCYITEDEYESMRAAAIIVDDGLLGAVEQLLQPLERPPTLRNLRAIRVAFAVIDQEFEHRGEREVMQEFWKEGSQSLETCLVDTLAALSDEIGSYFSVHLPPSSSPELVAQLFRTSDEALKLFMRLVPSYPVAGRITRTISSTAADLFVFTDAADMLYSQTSPACIAAQETRQSCVDLVRIIADTREALPGGKLMAEIVLRMLLEHGLHSTDHDPSHHLVQVFCLVDLLLPMPDGDSTSSIWIHKVLPNVLRELWAFARALDTENKAHLVRRLIGLDKGVIGIGDWLLEEELKELIETLRTLENVNLPSQYHLMRLYQVSLSLRFLVDLIGSSSDAPSWCTKCITNSPEVARTFSICLQMCIEQSLSSLQLGKIVRSLAAADGSPDDSLKIPLLLALLRTAQHPGITPQEFVASLYLVQTLLLSIPRDTSLEDCVVSELGGLIQTALEMKQPMEGDMADALLGLLEWMTSADEATKWSLQGTRSSTFKEVLDRMRPALSPERLAVLESLEGRFSVDDSSAPYSPVLLPESIELTVQDIEDLLHVHTPTPSTPPRKALNQDVLSLVAISPPTALIRSPASTGLTKTYFNNDFRQLRQTPSARQNTSRLPSMHVDVGSLV